MNILFLTSDFIPNVGGMATHAHELAKAHVRNEHCVHLVHPVYCDGKNRIEDFDGITIHKLFIPNQTPKIKHLVYIREVKRYVVALLKEEKIDVVHWHDLTPNCWSTYTFRKSIPLVWTNHTSNYLEYFESSIGRLKIKLFLHHADAIISPSKELHEKSAATGLGEAWRFYIPNGVDAEKFKPGNSIGVVDKDYGIDLTKPVILCPRRLEPKNGVEYLIRAIAPVRKSFPETQFLIVGGGFPEEKARFEALLIEQRQRGGVFFTGNVPNTVMPKFYALSTIAALPSLMEATSISGLEAMASGLPLVGTNVGGIPEIIENGVSGILVEPRNPQVLADAFVRLLGDEALRRTLGQGARKRVEKEFAWPEISRKTVSVYERAITKRKR